MTTNGIPSIDKNSINKNSIDKNNIYNIYGQIEGQNNEQKDLPKVEILDLWEQQFNTFYQEYPKKVKKQDVLKWFKKNKPSKELFECMMDKLKHFKQSKDWTKDNGQYIPYPSSWLNQKRWEDEETQQRDSLSALRRAWGKEENND